MSEQTPARPRVSVIVRTRNRADMLRGALQDVFAQTFRDVEVVVVDDGDDPAFVRRVVDGFGERSDALRVVDRTALAHGRAAAANAGIRAATGELLVLHDDDDAWKPAFLTETVAWLDAHPGSVAVSARTEIVVHRVDAEGRSIGTDRGPFEAHLEAITVADMLRANRVTTNSLLYRGSVHAEIGYIDESLAVLEDWDFYLRLIARHPIDLLPGPPLAEWHHRPGLGGDEGNSVFALSAEHAAAGARRRDEEMRRALRDGGAGAALHLAYEMQRLEERLETQRAERARAHDDLVARLDSLSAQVSPTSAQTAHLDRQIAELRLLIEERTSVTSVARRIRRLFARR